MLGFALAVLIARRPYGRALGPGSGRTTEEAAQSLTAMENGHGRQASKPSEIPATGWRDILWRLYQQFSDDRLLSVAAGVTFYALLALFPAVATLVSLYALFADPGTIQGHLGALNGILPGGAIDVVGEQLKRIAAKGKTALGFGFVIGLALSLWSANAGMKALFDGLNVAYQEDETRGFVRLTSISLLFTLGAIAFVIIALGVVVVVPAVLAFLGMKSLTDQLVAVLRWPVIVMWRASCSRCFIASARTVRVRSGAGSPGGVRLPPSLGCLSRQPSHGIRPISAPIMRPMVHLAPRSDFSPGSGYR